MLQLKIKRAKGNTPSFPHLEGILVDGFNDLLERDLGGESVPVVYDRFSFISVPAVQLHTATPLIQSSVSDRQHT